MDDIFDSKMNLIRYGSNFNLELKSVYHYRNRWSCGIIKGVLDLKDRTFVPEKKAGLFQIKSRADITKFLDFPEDSFGGNDVAEAISGGRTLNQFGFTKNENARRLQTILGDYCSLEKFIELHLNISNENPKYLSNLILNTLVVKKMWIARYSVKTRWWRYTKNSA
jgi:hypothetical protein